MEAETITQSHSDNCKWCKSEMLEKALVCPRCGKLRKEIYDVQQIRKETQRMAYGSGILGLVFLLVIYDRYIIDKIYFILFFIIGFALQIVSFYFQMKENDLMKKYH